MTLTYEYTTEVRFGREVGLHNILLRCLPARTTFQQCLCEELVLSEGFWHEEGTDGLGNRIVTGGTSMPHKELAYCVRGAVEVDTYCIPDPSPHPAYLFPTALTTTTRDMAALLPQDDGCGFLDFCLYITHAVHHHIAYTPGVTDMHTTAGEAFGTRRGVCQDYAHVMIALLRKAGIPARYVCGLMAGEGQTHAWVEAHDGNCWYAFDPTNDTAVAYGYIKLAHGRDVADCPVSRGMYTGLTTEETTIKAIVKS